MKSVSLDISGIKPLLRALDQMPEACHKVVLIPAAQKAGLTLSKSISSLIKKTKKTKPYHYKTSVTSVVRDYEKSHSVVLIVGAASRQAPHAHLVEDGTKQRFTNSRPKYRRTAIEAKLTVHKGRLVHRTNYAKKSIGSFIKNKKRPQLNRGIMPATHPVEIGVKAVTAAVAVNLKKDIELGITTMVQNYRAV